MKLGPTFLIAGWRFAKPVLAAVLTAGLTAAQQSAPPTSDAPGTAPRGWPRAQQSASVPAQAPVENFPDDPNTRSAPLAGSGVYQQAPPNGDEQDAPNGAYQSAPPQGQVPARLTLRPGTFVTVRVNQTLSSDHNQAGDAFSATLVKPVIVDGVVVAQRGQTLGGRVTDAQKAGRVEGTSRLAIQLTDLTLVDGQQIPIQSQFVSRTGRSTVGRDAGAIAGTTAAGAAIGAAADWGRGAAIGAGAGAAAGIVGVLLTRGQATVIYPESVLTFRVEAPVTIATENAPEAFRYVEQSDYDQPVERRPAPPMYASAPPPCYGCGAPAPYPYYGYAPYYAPYWGPTVYFYRCPRYYYGPRYGARGGYYYRSYRR